MASSPVKFFAALLVVCGIGWVVFVFAARLLAWFLSRIMGASVGFRVAGCNCLRDVTLKFKKGAVESVSIGELKISLRKSLVKLGFSFISRDPKLQVLICDLEVVIRPSEQSKKKNKSHISRSAGKGKWVIFTNMARILSISVTELVVKVPKAVIEVKDLSIEVSKSGGSNPILNIKLNLIPFFIHLGESRFSFDQSLNCSHTDCVINGETCSTTTEKNSAPFVCEDLSIVCDLGHEREGVTIRNLDVISGDVTIDLNKNLFPGSNATSESFIAAKASDNSTLNFTDSRRGRKNKFSFLSLKKHVFVFPEKVSFSMPKLDVKFMHWGRDLHIENNVTGIHLRSTKSQLYEDSGEVTSHFDVQIDLSEIHILREGHSSILEILKVAFMASIDVPLQPPLPIRAEVDVKLGGTQCNVTMTRLKPWLRLHSSKKEKVILRDRTSNQERSSPSDSKDIMWTSTISAPEMTIVLYGLNGLPLYHGCSQSSHFFANNIASKGVQIHTELGELLLHMEDEYQECLRENLFGVETNSASLMHIARVSLDWGLKEMESHEKLEPSGWKSVFSVDITGMGVHFGFQHIESIVSITLSFKELLKSVSSGKGTTGKKVARSSKTTGKGTQILKLNLERCSINFRGDTTIEDTVVPDPKRVNFGSQGGEVIISVSADGTPRRASISSTLPSACKNMKFSTSLDIFQLSACMNKEKESIQMDLERARSIFQECTDDKKPGDRVTLFDMQNAKFVRRSGGLNDIAVCSLFSATDITARWEPDVHLALYEVITRVRFLLFNKNVQGSGNDIIGGSFNVNGAESHKVAIGQMQPEKQNKRRESIFAVDVEMLKVSAEVADGVEAMIHVQSIFSENARIGVLLEGLMLSFNGARVFRSSRMQISRVPVSACNSIDAKLQSMARRDWVIQGLDVHICMPYRLPLRAIEDAVEDMLRGLKLISTAKANLLFPDKNNTSKKVKVGTSNFGTVRFILRKLTADIEEEPIQGWLDEHYQLLKNEVCESAVRLNFLNEILSSGNKNSSSAEPNDLGPDRKISHNGVSIDANDTPAIKRLQEEIQKKTFQFYYQVCQKLVFSEGSGACSRGFQAGFRPSTSRTSLLSLRATELDVTLTEIEGGYPGMVDFIKKVDPVSSENDVPFSRMYGRNIVLNAGSLALQLRNYTCPLLSATAGKCHGRIVLAQQATCFQPQIHQDVFIGRWRTVRMLRSASGTTPPMKMYSDLPICFHNGEVSFGVGYEPAFADVSYAFTVALRRANLSKRSCGSNSKQDNVLYRQTQGVNPSENQPPKKERSLPWWDDMRYYIHGKISLQFTEIKWNLLATTDPYEKLDRLQIVSGNMNIQQSDGRVHVSAKDFKFYLSSLESLLKNSSLKRPRSVCGPFLVTPAFSLEVAMDWECESGKPLDHYLHALPSEGEPRKKVYDPFRSTSLSLRWNFSLRPSHLHYEVHGSSYDMGDGLILDGSMYGSSFKLDRNSDDCPTMNMGAHDLIWIFKWWNMNYNPPHKLRAFSRWPRFGVPRTVRSGNLSLDKVMTEFFLRVDATPACIKHMPLGDDDPAGGLTFEMTKLKYELCYSRGKQRYTFESKRDPLDLVYRGLELHMLKVYLNKINCSSVQDTEAKKSGLQTLPSDKTGKETCNNLSGCTEKQRDEGFLLNSDYFTIRRQAPKADPARLLAWQDSGRKNLEMSYVRSEFENGSESDHTRSDPSDDDGFNYLIADNCQRVNIYGLKLLWTIENRDAVWSWVGGISKAFEPPKPSPSRQYAQRKFIEGQQIVNEPEMLHDDTCSGSPSTLNGPSSPQRVETFVPISSPSPSTNMDCSSNDIHVKHEQVDDPEEEGTRHFMVNVMQPQFNLHSEEANGRFLLAAASGRLLARSFHSVLHVGYEMIERALGTTNMKIPESEPEMTWKRLEFSAMLEHVQAHVAPTDVDPGAGLQWLPKILRSSPKVKRTGALLERVFMPCQMYFRYTRHKGGTADLKVKPLKELSFSSPNITATMTSRQFQVMLDVLSSLLFARLPKPRKSSLSYPSDDDEDVEEEADEVVPDGVEEVELAKINLEEKERERKLLLDDIRLLSIASDTSGDLCLPEWDGDLWMITGGKLKLVQRLKKELGNVQKSRKDASSSLRMALQKAAQQRLMEKEKNKSPSYAMRISMRINKVVWSMLADGKYFAEAEINDMIYDFDRDYKDIGVAKFTTKNFVVRNCLPNAKSNMLLSAWNAPPEWGKNVMLRVDAKQGAPKDGNSPLELFQVDIYPLKIHLTETMYRMMWDYFFPEEEQDSQRRQEVWMVSTTAGSRRTRKGMTAPEATASSSQSIRESDAPGRVAATATATTSVTAVTTQASVVGDTSHGSKLQSLKANVVCGSNPEPRRASSTDRTRAESGAEPIPNGFSMHAHPLSVSSSRSGPLDSTPELHEASKNKAKDSKQVRPGRLSHDEKKVGKPHDDKRTRARKMMEFHNIKISQVELLVTYEGSRFAVNDLRLLMDTFHRDDFTGTWRRLFSRVKKHIIWGVLKSVTGMQGKKFKDKAQSQRDAPGSGLPDSDLNLSDSDGGQPGKSDQFPISWTKRPSDGAGDGFVTSIRGLFNSQRRRAKAFVMRTMRGEAEHEFRGEWSESDTESSPFARQLTITKAKKLIRRHTKKFRSRGQKNSGVVIQQESLPSTPRETTPFQSDSSGSLSYEDFHE